MKKRRRYGDPVKVARLNAERWRRSERAVCAQLVTACLAIARIASAMNVSTRGLTLDEIADTCVSLALKKWRPSIQAPTRSRG